MDDRQLDAEPLEQRPQAPHCDLPAVDPGAQQHGAPLLRTAHDEGLSGSDARTGGSVSAALVARGEGGRAAVAERAHAVECLGAQARCARVSGGLGEGEGAGEGGRCEGLQTGQLRRASGEFR